MTAISSPPGTYLPPGATAPITDPGGTYSGADATAPTTDPAGTFSSPYALDSLFIEGKNNTPSGSVLSFNSVTAVENYYGVGSEEATLATKFFTGYAGTSATFEVTRQPGSRRPHLLSANLAHDTMAELDAINGTLDITFNGNPYDANINLAGVTSFLAAAHTIQVQVNAHLSVLAATTASSITPETTSFTGSINGGTLTVTSITSGSIERGGLVSGPKDSADQIERQMSGTPGGVGTYGLFAGAGHDVSSEAMTETYGMLTVGSVTSGNVALGELVTGAGVALNTLIITNLSGSGAGSTWVVDNSQTVAAENLNLRENSPRSRVKLGGPTHYRSD